ncbi:MAG: phosphate acetyltransferase [Peptostreptococcaceae bacterium]|nr:phosphate acetyltransferase [Peptostreptococcaceae bacterium]
MLTQFEKALKKDRKTLVFTEGHDIRIVEAASRLKADGMLEPILIGTKEDAEAAAKESGYSIEGITVINPKEYLEMDEMVDKMEELRKGKMTKDECREKLMHGNYFGTMLVKMGKADGLLGGATYSTADTVRPALQIIKTAPGSKIVSSCMVLNKQDENSKTTYVFGDCAINIDPSEDDLVQIALQTAETAKKFGLEPKVAMLSYSTLGSGKGERVDKVRNATEKLKALKLDFDVDGELQFDTAISPAVAKTKAKNSTVAGKANVFILPDIDAGNISYKVGARLGGYEVFGPLLQGLNAPINDLSRGCIAEEVYKIAMITVGLA